MPIWNPSSTRLLLPASVTQQAAASAMPASPAPRLAAGTQPWAMMPQYWVMAARAAADW